MNTKRDIGLSVKNLRKRADLTQEELGKKIKPKPIRKETISRLERGVSNYGIDLLFQIAKVLDCDVYDFFGSPKKPSKIYIFEGEIKDFIEKIKET